VNVIEPARQRGEQSVTVRTGDIHKAMGLSSRMPAVCSALGSSIFETVANVIQVRREGPPQGANVYLTFQILQNDGTPPLPTPEPPETTRPKVEYSIPKDTQVRNSNEDLPGIEPGKKTVIILPCSDRKMSGGRLISDSPSFVDLIDDDQAQQLSLLKSKVTEALGITLKPDELLPAYHRYTGNIYTQIPLSAWEKLENTDNVDVLIVSAMYGIVLWNEPIQEYDAEMAKSIYPGRRLNTWWKQNGLGDILVKALDTLNAETVQDFLSLGYREAVPELRKYPGVIQHVYPGEGMGSNSHRGRNIASLLGGLP